MGMLRIDPGERTTGRMLNALEKVEGLSIVDAERLIVGLSWMQEWCDRGEFEQQLSSVLRKMQATVNSSSN